MYRSIVFDLDGTLLDSLDDIAYHLNRALEQVGIPPYSRETVRSMVGHGLPALAKAALGPDREALIPRVLELLRTSYRQEPYRFTRPYDGIPELLDSLSYKGFRLGVLTNKAEGIARDLVSHFFGHHIHHCLGETGRWPPKPDPAGLQALVGILGHKTSETLMVGDGETDVAVALAAGITPLAATWGFRDREELAKAGATEFIDHPGDVEAWLDRHRA